MAKKQVFFHDEARAEMKEGADELAETVKVTMGPKGRNVILGKKYGSPVVTNDGNTIAKEIEFEDPSKNVGARMLRESVTETHKLVGGGTTTATLIAHCILREGNKILTVGANPMKVKQGIDKAVESAVNFIKSQSKEIKTKEDILKVATVAANNDTEIGNLIADALDKVGKDGVVTIEEAKGVETGIEIVEGMQFDRGYISPYMVTDAERMEAVMENPVILIHDKKISGIQPIIPLLQKVVQLNRPLLIIAEDVDGEALNVIVVNKVKGVLDVTAVKAPGYGDRRKEMLMDIAIATGGRVISEELGFKLENVVVGMLGQAKRIIVDKDNTTIIGGNGDKDKIDERIKQIRKQIEDTKSDYDREKLQERLAKLAGGVAIINIGAPTETAMKEKKARAQDSLSATKAALEEGAVIGGGVTLLRASLHLDKLDLQGDEAFGANIIKKALREPMRCIAENTGAEGTVIINQVLEMGENFGFNALTGKVEDLLSAGILDPTKTVCSALQSAASVAGMMLTTEAMITDMPEEEEAEGHEHHHHH
ncbi:TPA: chaperonin GroEL [Candidatus Poribacteria bacterium]|nr:chaperonin GroEL [Candidatus Poribacteria bacterium]